MKPKISKLSYLFSIVMSLIVFGSFIAGIFVGKSFEEGVRENDKKNSCKSAQYCLQQKK